MKHGTGKVWGGDHNIRPDWEKRIISLAAKCPLTSQRQSFLGRATNVRHSGRRSISRFIITYWEQYNNKIISKVQIHGADYCNCGTSLRCVP